MKRAAWIVALGLVVACAPPTSSSSAPRPKKETPPPGGQFGGSDPDSETVPASCDPPGEPTGEDITIAPEFQSHYRAFDLGEIPGVPSPLGGCTLAAGDPNTLLVAGNSAQSAGALYSIKVKRDACKHIVGWDGTATKVMDAPFMDASLLHFGPQNTLVYTMWSAESDEMSWPGKIAQVPTGSSAATVIANVKAMGRTEDQGPGGLQFVPPGLTAEGQLRAMSTPLGDILHIGYEKTADGLRITSVNKTNVRLGGWPGGFAYVPAGSPGFAKQSLIVTELTGNIVAIYEVDADGDPLPATKKMFFDKFPSPWGAYFDAITGDYLFLTWGNGEADRIYEVQGFAVPPAGPK
jgi:hypothetical protein